MRVPRWMGSPFGLERSAWIFGGVAAAALVAVPLGAVVVLSTRDPGDAWTHVRSTLLAGYVFNTSALASITCGLALVLGVVPAWLVTTREFPGRRWLDRCMILPLAVPPYLLAYAYADALEAGGWVRTMLKEISPESALAAVVDVRTIWGAAFVLAFSLFPYVYIAARQTFEAHAFYAATVGRTLGLGAWGRALRIGTPLCAPGVLLGCSLVVMETVADFGVADYCAVDTFSTGVYRAWLGLDSPPTAARLSLVILSGVMLFALAARLVARRRGGAHSASHRPPHRSRTGTAGSAAAICVCALPVVLGFIAPVALFASSTFAHRDALDIDPFIAHAGNTLLLAAIASTICVSLGAISIYAARLAARPVWALVLRAAVLGYAVPGTVVAVGLLASLTAADHAINGAIGRVLGEASRPGLLLTGSIFAIVLGCQTRFLAVSIQTIDASMRRVRPSLEAASRTLGSGVTSTFARVHVPLCRTGFIAAGLLVFADVVKELPMTLLLRPFNFDTFAVRAYQLASDERLHEASMAGLGVIACGMIPVLLLWAIGWEHTSERSETAEDQRAFN